MEQSFTSTTTAARTAPPASGATAMSTGDTYCERLQKEHMALLRQYGDAQERCSILLADQRAEIARLDAEVMGLRAAVIGRDSALAWVREDHAALENSIPGLPKRISLVRHIDMLTGRLHTLLRERADAWRQGKPMLKTPPIMQAEPGVEEDLAGLEASLIAADLVICQTGCLSHGEYWRVQDHCKRTGKACVLTAEPDALRIVRIHKSKTATEHAIGTETWVAQQHISS